MIALGTALAEEKDYGWTIEVSWAFSHASTLSLLRGTLFTGIGNLLFGN